MYNKKKIALLYSGGTDSTLAAVICAENYDELHLLTFKRFGLFNVNNVLNNVIKLKKIYKDKIFHCIIECDKIFKFISYESFFRNVFKFGFFNLTTCGLCKLAMHVRTAIYCIDNNIYHVADGANKGMINFPDQQDGYISLLRKYYSRLGIKYENPVYNFDPPSDIDFVDKFNLDILPGLKDENTIDTNKKTAGWILYKKGIFPYPNVKGTDFDRTIQARCFQFILFNIWLFWWYLNSKSYEDYQRDVVKFYHYKMDKMFSMIEEYVSKRDKSCIYQYL